MSKPYRANDMETLDQEKFSTVKALAEMQVQISEGGAALLKLKESEKEYLEMREKEVHERVAKVLAESRDALEQITKNHDELSHYGDDLKAQAIDLHTLSTQIVALSQHFREWMELETKKIDKTFMEIAEEKKQLKALSIGIVEDRKQLKREGATIAEEMRLLVDRRGLLERGFAELNRKQQKI